MKLLKKVPAYRLIMQPLPGESTKPPAPASPLKALAESSDIIEYALAIFITQHWSPWTLFRKRSWTEMVLTRGAIAHVDDEDVPLVSEWKWHLQPGPHTGYPVYPFRQFTPALHHALAVLAG